jgi:hypothetical protein
MNSTPPFQELQRFPRRWLLVGLGAIAIILLVLGPFSVVGWAVWGVVTVFLLGVRLRTEVRDDGLYVKLWPVHRSFRRIPWSDIERHEPIEYSSLRRFGGWGLRVRPGEVAYNVGGSQGVLIERPGGRSVVVGSGRAGELAEAIDTQSRH